MSDIVNNDISDKHVRHKQRYSSRIYNEHS